MSDAIDDYLINNWGRFEENHPIYRIINVENIITYYKLPIKLMRVLKNSGKVLELNKLIQYQIFTQDELLEVCLLFMDKCSDVKKYESRLRLFHRGIVDDDFINKLKVVLELVKDS